MPLKNRPPDSPPVPTARTPRPERQIAFRLGLSAESRAAAFLLAKGYRIAARRWRSLVFVEVKARASLDEAAEAVTPRQRRRIIGAAEAWLAAHPDDVRCNIRFDAILIAPRCLPRHIAAAFDAST